MLPNLHHLDLFRIAHPFTGYAKQGDTVGCFHIPHMDRFQRVQFKGHYIVIANDGAETGWDHVSIHVRKTRNGKREMSTPTWADMSHMKDLFFGPEETVFQFHPPKTEHINVHEHCLHLWKPLNNTIPLPPSHFV